MPKTQLSKIFTLFLITVLLKITFDPIEQSFPIETFFSIIVLWPIEQFLPIETFLPIRTFLPYFTIFLNFVSSIGNIVSSKLSSIEVG